VNWRLAVVGDPIDHSLSPLLHAAGLELAGLEGTSSKVRVKEGHADQLRELLANEYDALSITMPLKALAAGLCVTLDAPATRTGVVNSLLVRDGLIHGACTDGQGFIDSLEATFRANVGGMHVVVLGSGGAARGIVDALVEANVGSVSLYSRNAVKAKELARQYERVTAHATMARRVDLIVNTTPAKGRIDGSDVMVGVGEDTLAVDITYEPRISNWRALHDRAGCRTSNGLAMLAYQAALQMQWWWDRPIDGAVLLEAIS
jgi:shikimate dehydrogenase